MDRIPPVLKLIASAFLLWFMIVLVFFLCIANAVHGQPSTQPVVAPQIQQLKDLTDWAARLDSEQRDTAEQLARLQIEFTELLKDAIPRYREGDILEAGKTYRVGGAGSIAVSVPDVTLIGIAAEPVIPGRLTAINVLPGGGDCTLKDIRFDTPNAPAGRLGVKPCIRSVARGTRIINCDPNNVDTFVELMPGAENAIVTFCDGGAVRAGFVYGAGVRGAAVLYNTAKDSLTENLVRFSPQNGVRPENVLIAFNHFANPGNKAVVELRHVVGAVVEHNTLIASTDHSCVGMGDKDPMPGDPGGAENVRVFDNVCIGGSITIHAGTKGVLVEKNRFEWAVVGGNCPITVNGSRGTLSDVRIQNNSGTAPAGTRKPFIGWMGKEQIQGLVESGNAWKAAA